MSELSTHVNVMYPCVSRRVSGRTNGQERGRGLREGVAHGKPEDGDIERRAVAMIETKTQTTPTRARTRTWARETQTCVPGVRG